MSLNQKIQEDLKIAMKEKDEIALETLRMLNAQIINREKEKRLKLSKEGLDEKDLLKGSKLKDQEIIEVIISEAKKRREAISEYEKAQRTDLAAKENKELEVLKRYLPEQLSEKEINKIIEEVVEETDAKDIKDIGKVMTNVMPRLRGKADGNLVNKIVKEILS